MLLYSQYDVVERILVSLKTLVQLEVGAGRTQGGEALSFIVEPLKRASP
jgi:hypothetical protein